MAWTGGTTAIAVSIVTDSGFSFSIGYNGHGQASNGTTTNPAGGYADSSGIENINSYVWQPVKSAPGMQGRFDDCMGFGTYNMAWKNYDGRWMVSGYSNLYNTGQYNAAQNATQCTIMTTIAID